VNIEAAPSTGRRLRGRQGDAKPRPAPFAHVLEQCAPAAAQIKFASARTDIDLLTDVVVLAPLGLLEAQREVTVLVGAAEVRELARLSRTIRSISE
jgi:hypothetical protein